MESVESCIRGHHVLSNFWTPTVGEWLSCEKEISNDKWRYAVAVLETTLWLDTYPGRYLLLVHCFSREKAVLIELN